MSSQSSSTNLISSDLDLKYPKIYHTDVLSRVFKSLYTRTTTVLTGPTGIGKTIGLIDVLAQSGKRAIIVNPHRPAIVEHYKFSTKLFPNHKIGYRMRDYSAGNSQDDVTLMTTGYFLEQITYNPKMLKYPLILAIDEAHEADWQMDLVIRLALWAAKKNPKLKVILSSATLDVKSYDINSKSLEVIQCPQTE